MSQETDTLTVAQAARLLQVSQETIRRHLKTGIILAGRWGVNGASQDVSFYRSWKATKQNRSEVKECVLYQHGGR